MSNDLLPHLTDLPFVTDGGLETTLVFHERIDLRHFAAFDLIRTANGRAALRDYFLGGCCGADHRHVEAMCEFCLDPASAGSPD